MSITATTEFAEHYTDIYNYVKKLSTNKNILFAKSSKEVKYFDKSKYDIIYCLPRIIKKKLTCKTYVLSKEYSIPTFNEICYECQNGLWIEKPIGGSCGTGISILLNPTFWKKNKYVLQKYITPMLYKGYKFDIRVLVCYCSNGKRYILQDGIMRYASKKFDYDTDPAKHITNISYQKFLPSYSDIAEFPQLLSLHTFYKKLMKKINKIINDVLNNTYSNTKITKTNIFRILGFDIMFDSEHKGYFIECNSTPDIFYQSAILKEFINNNIYKLIDYGIKNA